MEMVNGTDSEVRCFSVRSPKSQDSYPGSPSLSPRHGATNPNLHSAGKGNTFTLTYPSAQCVKNTNEISESIVHLLYVSVSPWLCHLQEQTAPHAVTGSPLPTRTRATTSIQASALPPPPLLPPLPLSITPSPTPRTPPSPSLTVAPATRRRPGVWQGKGLCVCFLAWLRF